MSKVSFIKSNDRSYNVERSLSLIKGEVIKGLKNAKRVVVKPNCITDNFQLAATHKKALEEVFEIITPLCREQIVLAEGSGMGDTLTAFQNYDYFSLQERFNFSVIDLNKDEFGTIKLLDKKGREWDAQVAKTILDADYVVSVSVPKTHDSVIYTGAVKNVCVGSLLRPEGSFAARIASHLGVVRNNKAMIHQGFEIINKNIAILAKALPIKLAVIDGYSAMEGNGPAHGGEMVPAHWAIASSDPLAADIMACKLMGIDPEKVPYLKELSEEKRDSEPFVIGDPWRDAVIKFKMHSNFSKMIKSD